MGSSAEHFDAWFKERLEHFEEPPREAAWENIAEKLGHTRKKRVMVFILRIAAGMALTLSLGLGYYYYTQHRGISVPSPLTEKQQSRPPLRADESKKAAGIENKVPPETAASRSGISSAVQSENPPLPAAGLTELSGEILPPADSAYENKPVLSAPADLLSGIHALPAFIGDKPAIPGLALRQGGIRSKPLSETDLIVLENLAQMNPGEEEKNRHNAWILGGQLAPLYSYRNLKSDYPGDQDLNTLNNSEKGVIAYAGGVALSYKPSKRLSVESGIYYSKYGQEKTDLKAVAFNLNPSSNNYETNFPDGSETVIQVTITNSTGTITNQEPGGAKFSDSDNTITHGGETNANVLNIPTDNTDKSMQVPGDLTAFQYFEYLEVPLIVKYKIVDRKLDFHLLGGITTNFLTGNSVKVEDNGTEYDFGETDNIAKVNYSGSVGIGFEYPLLANLLLNIEPKFRYYLNPIDKSVNLNVYPYSFGLFAGISYVF
jgi:hypothetical protein